MKNPKIRYKKTCWETPLKHPLIMAVMLACVFAHGSTVLDFVSKDIQITGSAVSWLPVNGDTNAVLSSTHESGDGWKIPTVNNKGILFDADPQSGAVSGPLEFSNEDETEVGFIMAVVTTEKVPAPMSTLVSTHIPLRYGADVSKGFIESFAPRSLTNSVVVDSIADNTALKIKDGHSLVEMSPDDSIQTKRREIFIGGSAANAAFARNWDSGHLVRLLVFDRKLDAGELNAVRTLLKIQYRMFHLETTFNSDTVAILRGLGFDRSVSSHFCTLILVR